MAEVSVITALSAQHANNVKKLELVAEVSVITALSAQYAESANKQGLVVEVVVSTVERSVC